MSERRKLHEVVAAMLAEIPEREMVLRCALESAAADRSFKPPEGHYISWRRAGRALEDSFGPEPPENGWQKKVFDIFMARARRHEAPMKTGAMLIVEERHRQIENEHYSPDHDDGHIHGELAMAAACYAAPELIYAQSAGGWGAVTFYDPWPWERDVDKRREVDSCQELSDPETYSSDKRLDLLVKAGALIAAEIDRILRDRKDS